MLMNGGQWSKLMEENTRAPGRKRKDKAREFGILIDDKVILM